MKKGLILCLMAASFALAHADSLESGKVYLFCNSGRSPEHAMSVSSSGTTAVTSAYSDASLANRLQQWYVVGSDAEGFTMRNLQTGAYLTSNPNTSGVWSATMTTNPDASMRFSLVPAADGMAIYPKDKNYTEGVYICAHRDASNNVVTWRVLNSPASIWHPQEVSYTDAQLKDILDALELHAGIISNAGVYQGHLEKLFTDYSCWKLKEGIDAKNLDSNPDFSALPAKLKDMVRKVAGDNWKETSTYGTTTAVWDDPYARKYRLQLYEPYSEGAASAFMAGIQPYTNMNNPTGILGDKDELIYVMVNDDVPEGATLYIQEVPDEGMYNSATQGTRLHKGLNIFLCNNDNSHFFIYYTVTAAQQPAGANRYLPIKGRELSNYDPIKIHIEGGRINGFFNHIGDDLYTPDKREDFVYTASRATHPMYDFLGRYVILHLHLFDTPSQPGEKANRCVKTSLVTNPDNSNGREHDPVIIMNAWDRMCFAERILMGIMSDEDVADPYNRGFYESIVGEGYQKEVDGKVYSADPGFHYNEYFNNRMMGISMPGTLFMNATYWRTAYNVSTIESILTDFPGGSIWGPAHEYGHMNQGPMQMAGTTEESNNIFSNVATYYAGFLTSRSDFISNQLKVFEGKQNFLANSTWGTTRMFWQLWLYYHVTGHNKKFYPRLYELLRRYPIKKTTIAGGQHNMRDDQLHFAKMCCIAAEEDLTEFFNVWGFFVPLNGMPIDDYNVYNAILSQEDIDAAKAEIASYGFPKNDAIILIDDRPGNTDRESFGGFPKEQAGQFGGLDAFAFGQEKGPSGDFFFSINSNTNNVTVTGDGDPGAGFIIRDSNGDIIAFANSLSFEVSGDVARQLIDGTATMEAVGADKQTQAAVNTLHDGTIEQKKAILSTSLKDFDELLKYIDNSETKVGYFHAASESVIRDISDRIHELINEENPDSKLLTASALELFNTYDSLKKDPELTIQFEDGAAYRITSVAQPAKAMYGEDKVSTNSDWTLYETQWIVEGDPNTGYTLRSLYNFKYINPIDLNVNTPVSVKDQSAPFVLSVGSMRPGIFSLSDGGDLSRVLTLVYGSQGDNITVGPLTAGTIAYWTLTKVHTPEFVDLRYELGQLKEKAANLAFWDPDAFNDFNAWMEFYDIIEEANKVYNRADVSDAELEETVKKLRDCTAGFAARIHESIIMSASIGTVNDGIDDNETDVNRQAFRPENRFEGLITMIPSVEGAQIDTDKVILDIQPVGRHSWATIHDASEDEIGWAYEKAFRDADYSANIMDQYLRVGADYVDGFFMEERVSGRFEKSRQEDAYDLVLSVPCSGIYQITLGYANEDFAIFTGPDNEVPVFTVEIYPNMYRTFGGDQGLNIDGYTFALQQGEHDPTLFFPADYFDEWETRQCMLFIPGTYFVNDISASVEGALSSGADYLKNGRRNLRATKDDASNYCLPITLTNDEVENGNKLKLTVSKNGAQANYSVYLAKGEEGDLNVSTGVGEVESAEESDPVYYNINGVRIQNPSHGLYIRVTGTKAEKVIL